MIGPANPPTPAVYREAAQQTYQLAMDALHSDNYDANDARATLEVIMWAVLSAAESLLAQQPLQVLVRPKESSQ